MLEVVFSDSVAGAMLMAIGHQHIVGSANAVIIANENGEQDAAIPQAEIEKLQREVEEHERRGWENAVPFESNREKIINLPLALSIGNISETGIGSEREEALSLLMGTFPDMASQVAGELLNTARKSYDVLLKQVQNGEAIRVWVSREPDAMCGLYWIMEQLRPIGLETLDVTLVELPEWEERPDGTVVRYTGWGEVEPYRFGAMARLGKKLPVNALRGLASRWRELQQENSTLRAVLNGKLVSVSEYLYDTFILRELDKQENEFKEAQLVGQVLGKYQLGISDAWIALRIEKFIKEGLLNPITAPEPDTPIYHRILQKSGKN